MSTKIIVIGLNHAGVSFMNNVHKYNKNIQVTCYERNDNIAFLACGIALWVGGTIKKPDGLFYEDFASVSKKGATVHKRHEVINIDYKKKEITVKNLETNEEFKDTYDKLVLSTGSTPIIPKIDGFDTEGVFVAKDFHNAENIISYAKQDHVKVVSIVGGGYIGAELVEAFHELGKEVYLFENSESILSSHFDKEFTTRVEEVMQETGIKIHTNELVTKIEGGKKIENIVTNKGTYKSDLAVFAVGFRPNNILYKDHLTTLENGALIVDKYMQTSDHDVYACGDAVAVLSNSIQGSEYIALATNAVRTGILCGANILTHKVPSPGVQGSSALKIFGYNMASTGISEKSAKARHYNVLSNSVSDKSLPDFMPSSEDVHIKVVYDAATRRILGAQVQSKEDHTEVIHMFSLAVEKKITIDELALTDFFFLPHYNKPISWLTQVCLTAK